MNQQIGAALPFGLFEKKIPEKANILRNAFGRTEALLRYCAQNITFAELRTVRKHSDPHGVANAVQRLHSHGITATIHGTLDNADEFFAPYRELLCLDLQPSYNITVHPVSDLEKTVELLRAICDRIDEKGYPFFITLENQRITDNKPFGLCEEIAAVVDKVQSPHLGICFDFGHQLSNERKGMSDPVSGRFLSRVRHTHIHSFYEGRTHFPLDCGEAALEENLTALLENRFDGVLSLELSPDRYCDTFDVKTTLDHSISVLKTAAAQVGSKHRAQAFYRNDYLSTLQNMKSRFDAADNCIGLVGPSGYVMKFGHTRIAVDIAPGILSLGEAEQSFLTNWIRDFDAYILTHAHRDHYDASFFSTLPATLTKFVPDFMALEGAGIVKTSHNMKVNLGGPRIQFFKSGHKLGTAGVPEYGFFVWYRDETFIFPCDVRDYDHAYPTFHDVRMVFAHLWLGKAMALNGYDNPYIDRFCRFADQFHAKECYIAHLDDIHRTIRDMWSDTHVRTVCEQLPNAKPLKVGDLLEFVIAAK